MTPEQCQRVEAPDGTNIDDCQLLWKHKVNHTVQDAIGGFFLQSSYGKVFNKSLGEQYEERRKSLQGRKLYDRRELFNEPTSRREVGSTSKARCIMEMDQFDMMVEAAGYPLDFVENLFAFVQKAITLEKKLWDEFGVKKTEINHSKE